MNYADPGDHVPDIEWNNRVVQERSIPAYHRLSYKKIPRFMIRHLAMISTTKSNLFPDKGGISS